MLSPLISNSTLVPKSNKPENSALKTSGPKVISPSASIVRSPIILIYNEFRLLMVISTSLKYNDAPDPPLIVTS